MFSQNIMQIPSPEGFPKTPMRYGRLLPQLPRIQIGPASWLLLHAANKSCALPRLFVRD